MPLPGDVDESSAPLRQPLTEASGFVELHHRESEMVLLFCARRVLDPEVAVDLTAESFAQAFKGRRGFRGTTEVEARAWLLTIARRQIARYLKRGVMERSTIERLGIQIPALDVAEAEEIERRAGLADLRREVGAELALLSAEQRNALQLRVVEGRSYEEIAAMLGVQEATVRARVSRGLRALGVALDLRYDLSPRSAS